MIGLACVPLTGFHCEAEYVEHELDPLIYTISPGDSPVMFESAFHAVVQDVPLPEEAAAQSK